jgi:putative membrane protein
MLVRSTWAVFAGLTYLISTEVLHPWIHLPKLGNIGFTLVFTLFSALHCTVCSGFRRTAYFFSLAAAISYVLEETGVRTGWIYGPYHYSDMLGPKLGHVPVIIPLAWFMMIYPSWIVARALLRGVETRSIPGLATQAAIAAMVMTAWDVVMDPGMASAGNWVWERGGPWFGVPFHNYAGWLLTTFLVYVGAGHLWRKKVRSAAATEGFAALPIFIYALEALSYAVPRRIPELQLVALFAMVMPALLALLQSLAREN